MRRSTNPRLTRTRRRALAVPFVITFVAAGAACGDGGSVPIGDQPETTDVISNPTEPDQEAEREATISNPAEPETEPSVVTISNPAEPVDETEPPVTISNPAEPAPEFESVPDADLLMISNPAIPGDG